VRKKSKPADAARIAGDTGETEAGRGGGHHQQHQHEGGVGIRDRATNQRE
jgi:hypothetical protein